MTFIKDNAGLFADKVNVKPIAGPVQNYVSANDMNLLSAADKDIQSWLRGSALWYGLTPQSADPAPAGLTNYIWLKSDATLWQTVSGVTTQIGGGGGTSSATLTNANASTMPPGSPVYCSASGAMNLAKADNAVTAECIGLVPTSVASSAQGVPQEVGEITLTTVQWDVITGQSGGLTPGARYYVSATTLGMLTTTAPSTVGTTWIVSIATALTSTLMRLRVQMPIGN